MRHKIAQTVVLYIFLMVFVPAALAHPSGGRQGTVTVNFVDVDLSSFIKFTSEITGKNFIFDDRVKGKATIFAPSKLTKNELYNLFLSVLELKGFTLLPVKSDTYKIIPSGEAKQKGLHVTAEPGTINESYVVRLISIKNLAVDTALRFLQPVISKDGYISAFSPGNFLLVVDSGLNIEKIISIIEIIDQPVLRSDLEIIPLKHANAEEVSGLLNEMVGQRSKNRRELSDNVEIVPAPRLNAIIVYGDAAARGKIKSFILLIDVPPVSTQNRVNVYFLENANAEEMSKVLQEIVRSTQASGKTAGPAGKVQPFGAPDSVNITFDKTTNSLVIVSTPADYQNLIQVIKQLDQRPRQVFVEAMILEASIDRLKDVGTKWRAVGKHRGEPIAIGGFGAIDTTALQSILTGLSGFTAGGMGNYLNVPINKSDGTTSTLTIPGFAALFSLQEFKGVVDVLSTPQILTSDNKDAEIIVGENVPFITRRESDPSRTLSVFSTVERKDVGITLKITPHITEGDYVRLDLYQEISAVKTAPNEILISVGPTTTKRATRTSVVVKDKETVVIGGLMQERKNENVYKVPLLGDLPVLGWLFKYKSTSKTKTNLLVFLTPHIVKDAEKLGQLTGDKKEEFAMLGQDYILGEVLIKFKVDVSAEKARDTITAQGAEIIDARENERVYHIKLPLGLAVSGALKRFSALDAVETAKPVYETKK